MCCGCASETRYKSTSNNNFYNNSYEQDYKDDVYEFDITYKKDKDDCSPVVYVTQYGECYHTPTCYHTKNAYMKLTVKQAWDRGYLPCKKCCY